MTPDITVVIPTCQRPTSLAQVLQACGTQSLDPRRYEIVVSIDGCAESAEAVLTPLRSPYALRWTSGPRRGAAAARNRGTALARGAIILFLDDDIVPEPGCLEEHLAAHANAAGTVGLGCVRTCEHGLSAWERYLTRRYAEHFQKMAAPGYQPCFWDCLSGNLSLEREMLASCGGFDPRFRRHEDIELGYRLAARGACFVFRPGALAVHRFVRSQKDGLGDAVAEGASALQLAAQRRELAPALILARWQRYPAIVRAGFRWAIADPQRQAHLGAATRLLLCWSDRPWLPPKFRAAVYRLATHAHFWQGAQMTDRRLLASLLDSATPGRIPEA